MKIDVNYDGKYPNLCSGKWHITIDGIKLPELRHSMNTKGTYSSWKFDENYSEVFSDYEDEDGEHFKTWVNSEDCKRVLKAAESAGVKNLKDNLLELFLVINEHDFRSGSCGGCI